MRMRGVAVAAVIGVMGWAGARAEQSDASIRNSYILRCAGCHGLNGEGLPGNSIPDFHESGRFLNIPEGRAYLIEVPGVAQAHLSDREVADLLNWILATYSAAVMPKDAAPYTEAEVHMYRSDKARDAVARRKDLWARLVGK